MIRDICPCRRRGAHMLVACGILTACKLDPVLDLPTQPAGVHPMQYGRTLPPRPAVDEADAPVLAELGRQLAQLTDADFGGRRPGTEGAILTMDWIEQSMHEMGLSPAGVGGGWRQPVVVRVRTPVSASMELPVANEQGATDSFVQGEDFVMWRFEGPDSWKIERPIIDAGYGITAPQVQYDDYSGRDVKGNIVLIRAGLPPDLSALGDVATPYGNLDYKFARAHEAGAVACLVATGLLPGDGQWQALVESHSRAKLDTSNRAGNPAVPPVAVAGMLSADAEARLRSWLTARETQTLIEGGGGPANARLTVDSKGETIVDSTIIGRIVGSEQPREAVVIMAHWDAGGSAPPLVAGGALDNATGVAAMLAVARKSANWIERRQEPSRSIVFVATASDTLGMMGTQRFLESGPMSNSKIVALLSIDDLLVQGNEPTLGAVELAESGMEADLRSLLPEIRSVGAEQTPHSSQNLELARKIGIPSVTLTRSPGEEAPVDSVPPGASLGALIEDVQFVFDLAWRLADSDRSPEVPIQKPLPASDDEPDD